MSLDKMSVLQSTHPPQLLLQGQVQGTSLIFITCPLKTLEFVIPDLAQDSYFLIVVTKA